MRTYVIGDIGSCHDGDIGRMHEAVDEAKAIGLDAVKFQWTSDPVKMARQRGRAAADGYADVYAKYLAWPAEHHSLLARYCKLRGVDYMCTVFLPDDVAAVAPYVKHFKVASFEAEDRELIAAHRPFITSQRVFVSLGMGATTATAYDEIVDERALNLSFLACVSAYPAPAESLNLSRLGGGGDGPLFSGFSDHSEPDLTWTGALAVAAGASVVEAHLRLDHTDPGNPDYPHAMSPRQFADYIRNIRFAETCMGSADVVHILPCERPMAQYRVGA